MPVRNRSWTIVSAILVVVILALFVWQPWNRNGQLWGK